MRVIGLIGGPRLLAQITELDVIFRAYGSDLELTIRVRFPADVEGEGSAVLDGRLHVQSPADGGTLVAGNVADGPRASRPASFPGR